ncbi:uncharacterized protein K444DRAFT_401091 [Hyaloscypha bicolor E]|uniref:Zn(2)-C6 fungal-type domain-containing protein n=1 Tax=Hyaloscypha bicolor E TaxID=1095630 RepID=A0A2J6T9X9_9HELO|nr:uncharacterized protein K444DRAFT_401091 [Hyaloscypha bicolor E]PMD59819.1 hypothetical protein K444DRAFT_401091 [Hyaloscypha bicolor E]
MRKTLRRSCAACAKAKHSCDLRTPKCSRCVKRNCDCVYANEPLTSTRAPIADHGNISHASHASMVRSWPLLLSRSGRSVSSDASDMSMFFEAHIFDPFGSYPPTNLPHLRVQGLMQHFLSKIAFQYYPLDLNPSSNPFVTSWWPLALNDPALFHVTLQTASLDDELHAMKGFPHSELLMKDSVSLLRHKIQDQSLAYQDATMNAVVTLAAIEHGKGNLHVSKVHIDGVKRMVAFRGGLSKVKQTSPLTARMVPWVSLLVSGSPQFETQDDFGEGNGICAIQQWQRPFSSECNDPNLLDFDALGLDPALCNIVNRLRCILHDLAILSVTDLHDLTCFTLHRLMSLPPHTGVESQSPNISECLQYSISAYMLILQGATYYSHAHILNALVIQFQPHLGPLSSIGECQDSLLLWLLSVGAVASTGTNENYWFRGEAAAVSAALDIQCWGDVEAHLKRILWHETRSRDVFQQIWKEILALDLPLHSLAVAEDHEKPRNFSNIVT